MFKWLEGGMVEITAYPAGVIGNYPGKSSGSCRRTRRMVIWTILRFLILQTKKVSPNPLLCTVTSPLPKRDTKNVIALLSRI